MAFLTQDFALKSWTHRRPRVWTAAKAFALLPALRAAWKKVAHAFVCQSDYEVRSSRLPAEKCVVLHWPKPDSALLAADPVLVRPPNGRAQAPVAFVCRMDPWRKGIDRLCAWLTAYRASLPRPAVVLLVPRGDNEPPQLQELVEAGLIEWDWQRRGAALADQLQRCRGAMLLSRFDAQPRSLREALWLGLPILCTPQCGLDQVAAMLGVGTIVDGDSPSAIQAGFEALADDCVDIDAVRHCLDRREIGRCLLSALVAIAAGLPPARSYGPDRPASSKNPHHCAMCS